MQHNPTQNKEQPSWILSNHMKCVFMSVAPTVKCTRYVTHSDHQSYVHCFCRIDEATAFEHWDYH